MPDKRLFPGPIPNIKLLTPMSQFLNDGDPTDPENIVVTNGLDLRSDVRLVNKKMWEFFLNKYGGGPEIKKFEVEEKSKFTSYADKSIEVFFRKV